MKRTAKEHEMKERNAPSKEPGGLPYHNTSFMIWGASEIGARILDEHEQGMGPGEGLTSGRDCGRPARKEDPAHRR